MLEELERAVRAREILNNSRAKHKDQIEKIKKQRNELLLQMTECKEESIQYQNLERQIDALDQQEFDLHSKYKKILQVTDKEINDTIGEIVWQRFGSDLYRYTASGDAPDHDDGTA